MTRIVLVFVHVTSAMGIFAALAIEGAMLLQDPWIAGYDATACGAHRLSPRSARGTPQFGVHAPVWAVPDHDRLGLDRGVDRGGIPHPDRDRGHRRDHDPSKDCPLANALNVDKRHDPLLSASFVMRASLLIGIVFLMTVKPPLESSLIAMATATGAGLLAALACFGQRTSHGSMVSA